MSDRFGRYSAQAAADRAYAEGHERIFGKGDASKEDANVSEDVATDWFKDPRIRNHVAVLLQLAHLADSRGEGDAELAREILNDIGCECGPCRQRHEWEREKGTRT